MWLVHSSIWNEIHSFLHINNNENVPPASSVISVTVSVTVSSLVAASPPSTGFGIDGVKTSCFAFFWNLDQKPPPPRPLLSPFSFPLEDFDFDFEDEGVRDEVGVVVGVAPLLEVPLATFGVAGNWVGVVKDWVGVACLTWGGDVSCFFFYHKMKLSGR